MKTMFKAAALAATFITGGVATPVLAQALPPAIIVVVDMDQVFSTSAAGKQASAELKTRFDGIQARVQALRTQYGAEEQALAKSQPTAAGPAVAPWQAKVKDMQARQQKDQAELAKRDQDFQAARQSVAKQIQDAATPIITTVMKERGASIALTEGATIAHSQGIDVTTDVVARLDKSLPRVSTAAPAK